MILAVFFNQQRKLDLETQSAFVRRWKIVFAGLILDISSILILQYEKYFSHEFAMFVCHTYLLTILWKQVFGVLYIDTYISEQHDFKQKETLLYLIYGIVGSIVIMRMPVSGFMDRGKSGYTFGKATTMAYILAIVLLIRMLILLIQYRRQMTKNSKRSACCWIGLCLTATIIQFLNNELVIFVMLLGRITLFISAHSSNVD